jgi:hypothetical protein
MITATLHIRRENPAIHFQLCVDMTSELPYGNLTIGHGGGEFALFATLEQCRVIANAINDALPPKGATDATS